MCDELLKYSYSPNELSFLLYFLSQNSLEHVYPSKAAEILKFFYEQLDEKWYESYSALSICRSVKSFSFSCHKIDDGILKLHRLNPSVFTLWVILERRLL